MTRKEIIEEYNTKAAAYNDGLFTGLQKIRNRKYLNHRGPEETGEEFAARIGQQYKAMIILPNPDIE